MTILRDSPVRARQADEAQAERPPIAAGAASLVRRRVSAGAAAVAALWIGAAAAQDTDSVIEQVPVRAGAPADDQNIAIPSTAIETEQARPGDPADSPQVGMAEEKVGTETQLSQDARNVISPAQLNVGGRTAQASEPLSQRSEGRTGAIDRVAGSDRCNRPQTDPAIVRACALAIETRAAEFARPDPPPLSPEQRLLVDQRLREGRPTARTAVRRLAEEGEADTPEGQAVASVALRDNARGPASGKAEEEGAAVSAESRAVIEALVGGLIGTPPPPQ